MTEKEKDIQIVSGVRQGLNEAFRACGGNWDYMQEVLERAMMPKDDAERDETAKMAFACIASAVLSIMARSEERKNIYENLKSIIL